MSQFRFYVVNCELGDVFGTNDEEKARSYSASFEHYVIDSEKALFLNEDVDEEINELKKKWEYAEEDDEEDED